MGILTEHSEHSIVLNVALTLTASAAAVLLNQKWTKIRKKCNLWKFFLKKKRRLQTSKEKYFQITLILKPKLQHIKSY